MRNIVKYFVDLLLLIDLLMIAASGLLLGFVIPVGRVAQRGKYFLGLHRHGWVDMHLYLALLFIVLVVIHLGLQWKWIVQSTRQHFRSSGKWGLWIFAASVLLLFVMGWLVVSP
ncbi:MAG: hypothetical protein BA871_17050 [Desulfuromonadales bacterium C00003096]|jgi:hypothetical protein|nr:MAG: hypothetical protein BA871_17050 [Desulfuromonadales bacterium C00003096]